MPTGIQPTGGRRRAGSRAPATAAASGRPFRPGRVPRRGHSDQAVPGPRRPARQAARAWETATSRRRAPAGPQAPVRPGPQPGGGSDDRCLVATGNPFRVVRLALPRFVLRTDDRGGAGPASIVSARTPRHPACGHSRDVQRGSRAGPEVPRTNPTNPHTSRHRMGRDPIGAHLPLLPEEVGMRSGADQVQFVALNAVDDNPVRFKMGIATPGPCSRQQVIPVPCRQRLPLGQQAHQHFQLVQILSAPLSLPYIPLELLGPYRFQWPGSEPFRCQDPETAPPPSRSARPGPVPAPLWLPA